MHFPANREFNSKFVGFRPDLSPGFGVQLAEFIALMNVSCNPKSKRNRELIPRISENGFPVSVPKRNFLKVFLKGLGLFTSSHLVPTELEIMLKEVIHVCRESGSRLVAMALCHLRIFNDDSSLTRPSDASIQSDVHDQLGLDLRSTKGQVEILIVDHIDRPSAN